MSRIRKAYVAKFRVALRKLGARRVEQGVELLLARTARLAAAAPTSLSPESQSEGSAGLQFRAGLPPPSSEKNRSADLQVRPGPSHGLNDALARLDARLQRQLERFVARRSGPGSGTRLDTPRVFLCDAGLGGLARWLRAAGYEALWQPDIEDATLLREARERRATLLTTDSLLLERRVIRDGVIPTVWLPPTGRPADQLALVFRELQLVPLAPRCMHCGGELRVVDKAAVAERIPPRTARWLDEYFVCTRCDQLFWRGTHWQRINARLGKLSARKTGRNGC